MAENDTDSGFNVEYNRPKMGLTGEEPELTRVSDFTPSPQVDGVSSIAPHSPQKGERVAGEFIPFREEHEPYNLQEEDGIVCISKAHLYEIHPLADSVKRYPLTPLQIEFEPECVVYAQFKTDDHGHVKVEEPENEGEEPPSPYVLKVEKGKKVPASTNFTLPDGLGGAGVEGEYNIPICFIEESQFKKHQFDSDKDKREAQVRGSLEGQRGPMFWIHGYDALKNVGGGENVYRDYTEGNDFKNLRTLKSKGQQANCSGESRVSGGAQINVATNGDNIEIYGNRYNATWKVAGKKQGIIEDGLVRCIADIDSQSLETVSVLSSSTTTGGDSTLLVARCPSESQKGKAWGGGATNAKMIEGIPHNKMWSGGTEETIPWVKICVSTSTQNYSGNSEACYWVLGYEINAANLEVTPASVTYVDSPISCVGVTSAVQITGIANSTTDSNLSTLVQDDSITDLLCVTIASATTTVDVYKSVGDLTVLKSSTGDQCDSC